MLSEAPILIRFYKPYGVLPHFTDPHGRPTLAAFIPVPGVYAAGRLDFDSEGLLLLTNDGSLNRRLTDPTFHHPKTYVAQVERVPDESALRALREGVIIAGYRTRPAVVERVPEPPDLPERHPPIRFRKNVPTAWLRLTLTEGKNRQVRHMTASVGHPTLRLIRTAVGRLTLDGLRPGDWRRLSDDELAAFRRELAQTSTKRR
jgi:pseudouridine synthase